MARSINRLTARAVDALATPGRHGDGGNLFLIVDRPTLKDGVALKPAKRWAFIFRWDGKLKEMGLGGLTAVSLARARELAGTYRAMLAAGVNPIDARRAELSRQTGRTFGEVAMAFHEAQKGGWKNSKYAKQWLSSLEHYAEPIWSKPIDGVAVAHVLAILQPIWTKKAETATRTREKIEAVIDAARARGFIPEDRANPARWKGHLSHLLPKLQRLQRGHYKALPYGDVAAFMNDLRARPAMAAMCLEFTILTAARSAEALGARWSEIDLVAKVWVLPPARMKGNREHRVPLSDRCVDLLRELEKLRATPDGFVFPGQKVGKSLSSMSMEMLLRRMKVENATVHGFRSTFRDWCGECTAFPREIAETALAHQVGNSVERSYRRGDALEQRRKLMQAWADYCSAVTIDNVLRMRKAT